MKNKKFLKFVLWLPYASTMIYLYFIMVWIQVSFSVSTVGMFKIALAVVLYGAFLAASVTIREFLWPKDK